MSLTQRWTRKCQECLHIQFAAQPSQEKDIPNSYLNAKCRKCHSESLDYGRERTFDEELKIFVEVEED